MRPEENGHGRRTIVVGVDGSVGARRALDWAVAEAEVHGWGVHVVHAWSVGAAVDFAWVSREAHYQQSVAPIATTIRDVALDSPGVELTWSSVEGSPAEVLVATAAGTAMLVLAAHHGLAISDRPLGSVTSACLRGTTVAVVVVPPALTNGAGNGTRRRVPVRSAPDAS